MGSYEYSFSRIGAGTNWQWVNAQAYSSSARFNWTPTVADGGANAVVVYARNVGSAAAYEAANSVQVQVNVTPAASVGVTGPAAIRVGSPGVYNAQATGGTGSYQYSFWRIGSGTNWQWLNVQPYSSLTSYSWTPSAADVGGNAVVVYARNAGSTSVAEAEFSIQVSVSP